MAAKNKSAIWSDVETRLSDFDRAGLLKLLHDLYGRLAWRVRGR